MSTQDNGGPAFPSPERRDANDNIAPQEYGMALRDYFAAKAMQAMIESYKGINDCPYVAKRAYSMADAMLKVRGES